MKNADLSLQNRKQCVTLWSKNYAQMAESVDALVSNTSGAIHPGSIPGLGTLIEDSLCESPLFFVLSAGLDRG